MCYAKQEEIFNLFIIVILTDISTVIILVFDGCFKIVIEEQTTCL